MQSILYGYILEPDSKDAILINEKIIDELSHYDKWPPITQNFFKVSTTTSTDIQNGAFEGRLIHLGGTFKTIENEIEEWLMKFESIISKMIWLSIKVHLITSYSDSTIFEWSIDLKKNNFKEIIKNKEINKNDWSFNSIGAFSKNKPDGTNL